MHAGQTIGWNGDTYKLDRQIGDEWQLINENTLKASVLKVKSLYEKYGSGEISFYTPKRKYIPEVLIQQKGEKIAAHLDLYTESAQEKMKQKRLFLESFLKKFGDVRSQSIFAVGIKDLWNTAWGDAPSPSTGARWLKRYIEAGRDIRSLGSGDFRKGNTKERYPLEVTEMCNAAIEQVFLKTNRGSIGATLTVAEKLIRAENSLLPQGSKLIYPKLAYIKALISRISKYDKDLKRFGATATAHKYRNSVHGVVCNRPLERVEIDHTRLDIVLADSATGEPIGRPWLTMVIDVYTRAILGFSLSYDPPSHMTVAKALKMALLPKSNLKKRWSSIKGQWFMFGCMVEIVVDNGFEFHCASLEAACYQLGINISFCPRKKSWWKAHIERAIGTVNRAVTDGMPGRTFSGIKEKGEYNSVEEAAIPLDIMEEMIAKWIVDIYHETTHSELGLKPREAWESAISLEDIPLVTNANELDAVMGIIATRGLSHMGIAHNILRYNSDELGEIKEKFGELKKVTMKWNPEDLGYIHVFSPDGRVLRVPAVPKHYEYANGLTNYQHLANKLYSKKYLGGRDDVEALSISKAELRELAEKGMRATSKKTRVQNQRMLKQHQNKSEFQTNVVSEVTTPMDVAKTNTPRLVFETKLSNRQNNKD
jgi:putative transposase